MPAALAATPTPACGVWLGAHTSSLPSLNCATQFCGSSGECGMNGYMYAASTTIAAPANALSTSPSVRSLFEYAPLPSSSALAWKPSLPSEDVGCAAHVTFSCCRADWASHQLSATIATPLTSSCRLVPPSTTNACFTPGSFLISSTFDDVSLAPKTGAFSYAAYSIPGS